ncbi:hypothetical protein BLNAU_14014 [Blattamonas nauphoetae]|uniref:HMG box domain-containing protein n=1 Tax=Blattamonas nauphoetae TaxID=2049346 RepID=A0ABQ9XF02_9EUKA|nr:hypothetical protein BLNAU_14014 [Blattamonas nauphoetae]
MRNQQDSIDQIASQDSLSYKSPKKLLRLTQELKSLTDNDSNLNPGISALTAHSPLIPLFNVNTVAGGPLFYLRIKLPPSSNIQFPLLDSTQTYHPVNHSTQQTSDPQKDSSSTQISVLPPTPKKVKLSQPKGIPLIGKQPKKTKMKSEPVLRNTMGWYVSGWTCFRRDFQHRFFKTELPKEALSNPVVYCVREAAKAWHTLSPAQKEKWRLTAIEQRTPSESKPKKRLLPIPSDDVLKEAIRRILQKNTIIYVSVIRKSLETEFTTSLESKKKHLVSLITDVLNESPLITLL